MADVFEQMTSLIPITMTAGVVNQVSGAMFRSIPQPQAPTYAPRRKKAKRSRRYTRQTPGFGDFSNAGF